MGHVIVILALHAGDVMHCYHHHYYYYCYYYYYYHVGDVMTLSDWYGGVTTLAGSLSWTSCRGSYVVIISQDLWPMCVQVTMKASLLL